VLKTRENPDCSGTNLPKVDNTLKILLLFYRFIIFIVSLRLFHWHPITTQEDVTVSHIKMSLRDGNKA